MLKDQNIENMRNPEYAIGKRKKIVLYKPSSKPLFFEQIIELGQKFRAPPSGDV